MMADDQKPNQPRGEDEIKKILSDFYAKQAAKAKTWQSYDHDIVIDKENVLPVGFVKGYHAEKIYEIIKALDRIMIFPHFCCSLYGPPGKEPPAEAEIVTPKIYYSSQYNNVGTDCFVKSWDTFMMFVGWSGTIMNNLQLLVASAKKEGLWSGNDMITDLFYLAVDGISNVQEDYLQKTESMRSIYTAIGDRCDYPSLVLASAVIRRY